MKTKDKINKVTQHDSLITWNVPITSTIGYLGWNMMDWNLFPFAIYSWRHCPRTAIDQTSAQSLATDAILCPCASQHIERISLLCPLYRSLIFSRPHMLQYTVTHNSHFNQLIGIPIKSWTPCRFKHNITNRFKEMNKSKQIRKRFGGLTHWTYADDFVDQWKAVNDAGAWDIGTAVWVTALATKRRQGGSQLNGTPYWNPHYVRFELLIETPWSWPSIHHIHHLILKVKVRVHTTKDWFRLDMSLFRWNW